jgi:hypothetical protein
MKFFTMNWWLSCQKPAPQHGKPGEESGADAIRSPDESYRRHLAAIRDRFPAPLVDLNERCVLREGVLREVSSQSGNNALTLSATVDDGSGWESEVELCYQNVASFRVLPWDGECPLRTAGFGDMGYDELDVGGDGLLVHRLLFRSGIEFEVTFQQFEFR